MQCKEAIEELSWSVDKFDTRMENWVAHARRKQKKRNRGRSRTVNHDIDAEFETPTGKKQRAVDSDSDTLSGSSSMERKASISLISFSKKRRLQLGSQLPGSASPAGSLSSSSTRTIQVHDQSPRSSQSDMGNDVADNGEYEFEDQEGDTHSTAADLEVPSFKPRQKIQIVDGEQRTMMTARIVDDEPTIPVSLQTESKSLSGEDLRLGTYKKVVLRKLVTGWHKMELPVTHIFTSDWKKLTKKQRSLGALIKISKECNTEFMLWFQYCAAMPTKK
jgi:hypothetical protein